MYGSGCGRQTCWSGTTCNRKKPCGTSNTEHALMVPVGLTTALATGEACMTFVALARHKDEQGNPMGTG